MEQNNPNILQYLSGSNKKVDNAHSQKFVHFVDCSFELFCFIMCPQPFLKRC